jgi:Ca-activated chloride channel homolog
MNIANPLFLSLLAVPMILMILYLRWGKDRENAILFSQGDIVKKLASPFIEQLRMVPVFLRIIAITLVVLALARFQWGLRNEEFITKGTDIIICLDTSPSMKALDFDPRDRITVAREVVKDFISGRSTDRIGMVVFAGSSVTICPLTSDYQALQQLLGKVQEGITRTDGTAIGDALATSINRLKTSKAESKLIILVTDGRNNVGSIDPLSAAKLAKAMGIKIYAIGVGKKGRSRIPTGNPFMPYAPIDEDLNEDELRQIASLTGGEYRRATDPESLKEIFAMIDRMEKTEFTKKVQIDYKELYPLFLWPAFLIFALEIILTGTVLRKIP